METGSIKWLLASLNFLALVLILLAILGLNWLYQALDVLCEMRYGV